MKESKKTLSSSRRKKSPRLISKNRRSMKRSSLKKKNWFDELPLQLDRQKVEIFCKNNHIVYLGLFGSILTPHFSKKSDVDFLVKFEEKHVPSLFGIVTMESELSDMIGRKADLKTAGDLSRYFREEVIAHAKVIYSK